MKATRGKIFVYEERKIIILKYLEQRVNTLKAIPYEVDENNVVQRVSWLYEYSEGLGGISVR